MIPKTIHYCWFGGNPLPKLAEKCIKSWKKYCPDYEIIRWDESNYDIASAPLYVRQAYEAKKWAFVTDYVRLQVIYEHGGIYLDTDVELIKPLDRFLAHQAYFGFEDQNYIATGLGFGGKKGTPILFEMMEDYTSISFVLDDGSYDMTSCPVRNTNVFLRHGLIQNGQYQEIDGFALYPKDVFCPKDNSTKKIIVTDNTSCIHHYSGSWVSAELKRSLRRRRIRRAWCTFLDYALHIPHRIVLCFLGETRYARLKFYLKHK